MNKLFRDGRPAGSGRLKGLYVFETGEKLFRTAARVMIELCYAEVARKGYFTVVLSGGSTPLGLYSLLASEEFRARVTWRDIHFFWGDERCVPPGDPMSNYGEDSRTMLSRANVPEENIHRMRGEMDPGQAAIEYEREITGFFSAREAPEPVFDLVFLGLGPDGHTLSLFPNGPELAESERLVVESRAPSGRPERLTMTLPLVNKAGVCVFLVTGSKKAGILKAVMEDDGGRYPASLVSPVSGNLAWFVDTEAASAMGGSEKGGR